VLQRVAVCCSDLYCVVGGLHVLKVFRADAAYVVRVVALSVMQVYTRVVVCCSVL